ncbi:hypothetical protein FSP39_018759 [Pinctada imbricata]|uniref:Exonuclease domain-containing protein n=1 Tax=Pinctada imbricata TaxID=66713 RepID=A0AA89BI72_PINIB|nr:hypothetical protein FSP39_018759 [Pinctada imbricata]
MFRNKKGKFQSKKSYLRQFKAQESKRNLNDHHYVEDPIKEDHCYDSISNSAHKSILYLDHENCVGATCTIDPTKDDGWRTGRRVVELQSLAQQMYCVTCDSQLHLGDIERERRIEVSFDSGWQKRGIGWNYNSSTGHGSMIGKETGKVLQFSLRSKACHICALYQSKNHTVPAHECTKNWDGSSKGMEPDMAISMAKDLKEAGCPINVIHGDNDSTTTSRLQAVFPSIEKKDDANHTKKSITSKLYKLSQKHKSLKQPNVISYIGRCFMYAIKESQSKNPDRLKSSLDVIVPHLYGDHSLCAKESVNWCSFLKNPSQARYRSLPGGKPLTCLSLQTDLISIVQNLKDRATSLVNLGSTQANENFNFIVSTKAPKQKSFGSSKSLKGRLAASVLQKNEGHGYLTKVNKSVGLSPGEFTMTMATKIAAKRKAQKSKQASLHGKRGRLMKKIKKGKKETTNEVHEGVTYSTAVELDQADNQLTTEIPQRLTLPTTPTYVIFDIETTGLGRTSDILQISADNLNIYIQPRCSISEQVSIVTGIRFDWDTKKMFVKGKEVNSKPVQEALLDFVDYVKRIPKPILVGHNACNFDIPVLTNRLREFKLLGELSTHVLGFVDTLKISKRIFKKCDVSNYKQENLVKKLTTYNYCAHDAKEDVQALKVLFTEKLEKEVKDEDLFHIGFHQVKSKYDKLLKEKCLSSAAVTSLARNGVTPFHLKLAYERNFGLKVLLKDLKLNLTHKYMDLLISFLQKEE